MQQYAPIVLFVYNRPHHTKQTLQKLKENTLASKSDLIIYSDGPKNASDSPKVSEVRQIIDSIDGFSNITRIDHSKNKGLAASIIEGVSEVIGRYNRIIVLEDDLVTSPYFLEYMNEGLATYKNTANVFSISGYTPQIAIPKDYKDPVYWVPRCASWGWGTWADRWEKADWAVSNFIDFMKDPKAQEKFNYGGNDMTGMLQQQMSGNLDSWAIRWCFSHYQNQAGCIYPTKSKVINIGIDGSGTHHAVTTDKYNTPLDLEKPHPFPVKLEPNIQISRQFKSFHDISEWIRFKRMILRILKSL